MGSPRTVPAATVQNKTPSEETHDHPDRGRSRPDRLQRRHRRQVVFVRAAAGGRGRHDDQLHRRRLAGGGRVPHRRGRLHLHRPGRRRDGGHGDHLLGPDRFAEPVDLGRPDHRLPGLWGRRATPLFALDFADGNTSYAGDATSSNTSAIPAGLATGSTALAFGTDNGAYVGTTTGTRAEILSAIANSANWTLDDGVPVAYKTGFTVTDGGVPSANVSISDVTLTEGDAGDQVMTFTVTRTDTTGAFTVDFATADGSAQAGDDYAETHGTLAFAAGGPASQTISVTMNGDATPEPNETFTVNLSNLVVTSGAAALVDAVGQGTIVNDDFAPVAIYDIQGAGHTSAYDGQTVSTQGVVTAIDTTGSRGFWIQDADRRRQRRHLRRRLRVHQRHSHRPCRRPGPGDRHGRRI
jgi:hypothetical protein